VAPTAFAAGDVLEVKVNALTSVKSQLSYDYYKLPFCKPENIVGVAESLGEVLAGDKVENSLYKLVVLKNETCKKLCAPRDYPAADIAQFKQMGEEEYRVNMVLDNLPVAELRTYRHLGKEEVSYNLGLPLTSSPHAEPGETKQFYLNNHITFTILYHKVDNSSRTSSFEKLGNLIVGFEAHVSSVKHTVDAAKDFNAPDSLSSCKADVGVEYTQPLVLDPAELAASNPVVWTYDVLWKESDKKWVSRWDVYLNVADDQIHWFSIINSLVVLIFLTGMVAMIMLRILHRDLTRYNELDQSEEMREVREETGWKLVFGDVFRPPKYSQLLSAMVGTGVQVTGMVFITMFFAVLGFLSPSNRGALMTACILLFVLLGGFGGYWSARFCKMFKGTDRKKNTLLTALLYPAVVFTIFFVLDLFMWGERSSGATPFGTIFALMVLWFGISVPLAFVGSYLGFRAETIEHPVRTNSIPRQIPEQVWYMRAIPSIMMGGILPFGAVFVELFFILNSIWQHRFYYLFGFLFLVLTILVLTSAEITIVMTYFQLCSEDYHWWWRSFFTSGSSAIYLFLYSVYYYFTRAKSAKFVAALSYVGYCVILSYTFFVLTGFVGFVSCFLFIRKIYASVKID